MPRPKPIRTSTKTATPSGSKRLSAHELKCLEFVEHYLACFNASEAARRMGYKGSSASTQGSELLHNQFTQEELKKRYERHAIESKSAREEIISMLYREANYFGIGSSHSARVKAQSHLAKIFGLEEISIKADIAHGGGVMIVPACNTIDEWEEIAAKQQDELKKTTEIK